MVIAVFLVLACCVNGVAAARRLAELRVLLCAGKGTNRHGGPL